jgi:transposase
MANQMISMNKIRKLIKLCLEAKSLREISKLTGMSRNTIDKYKEILDHHPLSFKELLKLSDKELYSIVLPPAKEERADLQVLYGLFPDMEEKLKRVGVTKHLLWEQYKTQNPLGLQYSRFCEHFNRYLKSQQISFVMEHKAGDKLMIDFAGKKLHLIDPETGEIIRVEFFVAILACSGYTYAQACLSQKSPDFLNCLSNCLSFFQGVPAAIVTDNLKPAVNRASKYDPEINQSLADFADYYDTVILPTRARKPKDKALVESAVNILYTRVYAPLHDQIFYSLQELNKAIGNLLDKHNDMLFQKKDYSRRQQFLKIEQQSLKPLPTQSFELKKYQKAKVHPNCHVFLSEDKHNYSVPYQYVGKEVSISYTTVVVEIYYKFDRIAIHDRHKTAHKYTTNTSHLHPNHQYYSNWSEEYFINQGISVGQNTSVLIRQLLSQCNHPEQGFKSCQGVLQLTQKYGNERLENASTLCLQYDFVSYRKLENILARGFDKVSENQIDSQNQLSIFHDNIRGESYYK